MASEFSYTAGKRDEWEELGQRVVTLVREDKELHDAIVRILNSHAANEEFDLAQRKERASKKR